MTAFEVVELEAKIAEQRAYIDLLVKAGKGSQDEADRLKEAIRAEVARTDSDAALAFRLEEVLIYGESRP